MQFWRRHWGLPQLYGSRSLCLALLPGVQVWTGDLSFFDKGTFFYCCVCYRLLREESFVQSLLKQETYVEAEIPVVSVESLMPFKNRIHGKCVCREVVHSVQAWAGYSWHRDDLSSGQHKEAECGEAHDENMVARWEIGIAITSGAKDLCIF